MNRRIELLKYTILKRNFGGPFNNWLLNCFGPTCVVLAKRHIEEMGEEDEYIKIKLKGQEGFLFFNKSISIHSLYQTLAEQLYDWQWHYYQIPHTKIEANDIVFDCGAAEGIFPYLNHKRAKHIYVFEPLVEYFHGLKKTFKNQSNVTLINCALGRECGTAYLRKDGIASSITTKKTETEINIDTIDHFCEMNNIKPSYIKADIEGYEMNLLYGASKTIKEYTPKIAITTYHRESHANEIAKYLLSINPSYNILSKGIEGQNGAPVMLHAWMDRL